MNDLEDLLKQARSIWVDKKMAKEEIAIALGVVFGDICRIIREEQEKGTYDRHALEKELGNVLFSVVRWIDDLELDVNTCLDAAIQAQRNYVKKQNSEA